MLIRIFALWILTCCLAARASGQSLVFEQELTRFIHAETATHPAMLGKLGPAAKISYRYEVSLKVIKGTQPNQFTASLYVEPAVLSGTRRMEGFDVTPVLWPDSIYLNYSLAQPNGPSVLGQTVEASSTTLKEGLRQNLMSTADWSKVRFSIKIQKVAFSAAQIQALADAKAQMARFAFATGTLATLPADKQKYQNVTDPDTLDYRLQELVLLESILPDVRATLARRPFWLTAQDAQTTQSLLAESAGNITELRASLESQAGNIRELVRAKANKLYQTARRERAKPYYIRLLALEPGNEQAIDRLALLALDEADWVGAARLLIRNAALMQGFSHQRTVDKTGRALEVSVVKLTKGPDPEAARPQVFLLDSLCKSFPGYRCPNLNFTRAATPVRDVYAKLMNKARVETSQDRLEAALTTIASALSAAQDGALPVANQQSALTLQKQIVDRLATKLCYQSQTAYRQGKDSLGTEYLVAAKELTNRYGQILPGLFGQLLRAEAEPYAIELVSRPGLHAADVAARKNGGRYMAVLGLETSGKVAQAATATAKSVSTSDCKRAQAEVNEWVNKGVKAEKELAFVQAQTHYLRAQEAARRKLECLINAAFIAEKLGSIEKPAAYQKLVAKAESHLSDKQYDSAFVTYVLAEKLYDQNNLAERFLIGVSIPATVRVPRYAGFALFAGERYLTLNELDSALAMAQVSAKGKPNKAVFGSFANRLAQQLAIRDRKAGPKADPKRLAAQYSQGNKKLKEFEKAYLKAWETTP